MDNITFSPIEETISFYTRNDFAIMNNLLINNYDDLWKWAVIAYNDNQAIIAEYERGERTVKGDYDIKWLNCLKKRVINGLNNESKRLIIENAKRDISNILNAMYPAKTDLHLYRTAWIDKEFISGNTFAYSREYKDLKFVDGDSLEIRTISSYSLTPYREDDDVGSDFYRYEISVSKGKSVLELDEFISHNEDGEVLLPPMKCKIVDICNSEKEKCKGVIKLEYTTPLTCDYN